MEGKTPMYDCQHCSTYIMEILLLRILVIKAKQKEIYLAT